jgi:histone-lysine N-methyltransferase SETMAR
MTSEVYCETLKELPKVIQNKKHGILTPSVLAVFLRDNADPHTAARTRALLQHLDWELFNFPPYIPDLAPSGYHLFAYMENWLGSQCFNSNEDFMQGV